MRPTTFSVDADEEVADVDTEEHVDFYADCCGLCLCLYVCVWRDAARA